MATRVMNLADPELELVDPTPNVHILFLHFDEIFFWTKLANRAVVRWSKRMYSCAGVCSYEGRGGLCDIALSEPLLKLRPRKDLVETLLHEMIHAFLFITDRDQDRDGHGPNFKAHMHRINKSAGINISIYHDFHDEVELYRTHWWRCDGPCQKRRPHYGIVRRSMNKPPGTYDYWWNDHKRKCGGTFVKIKEPENTTKKATISNTQKNVPVKPNVDISKYLTNNNSMIKTISSFIDTNNSSKSVLKDSNTIKSGTKTKSNGSGIIVSNKGVGFNPTTPENPSQSSPIFTGNGYTTNNNKHITDSRNVTEHVRNIWANKKIPTVGKPETSNLVKKQKNVNVAGKPSKHKAKTTNIQSPPAKVKKIDDYFKANASMVLKDLYGEDFKLTQSNDSNKLVAVSIKEELVDCPVCGKKYGSKDINRHLDECLNKDVIEKLSQDNEFVQVNPSQSKIDESKQIGGDLRPISAFKGNLHNNVVDLTNLYEDDFFDFDAFNVNTKNNGKRKTDSPTTIESIDMNRVSASAKQIININDNKKPVNNVRKSDSFVITPGGYGDVSKIKTDDVKPSTSKEIENFGQECPCCGQKVNKSVDEHLDECLVFFNNDSFIPEEGANTSSYSNSSIVIVDDEDDRFDESQVFNATGTKTPCPCCMKMIEEADMNEHLDICLG